MHLSFCISTKHTRSLLASINYAHKYSVIRQNHSLTFLHHLYTSIAYIHKLDMILMQLNLKNIIFLMFQTYASSLLVVLFEICC